MDPKLLEKIKGWHIRASAEEEKDYFVKFIFDYLAFIAFLNSKYRTNNGDRNVIQNLKQDMKIKSSYLEKLDQEIIITLINELEIKPLTNDTNSEDKWWDSDNKSDDAPKRRSPNDGQIESAEDYKNMIEFIYRTRNNLFHGQKGPDYERDAFIVEYGFYLLNPLTTTLLAKK